MVKLKHIVRVGSKVFDLEVSGVDDFGADTLFHTKIVCHYRHRTNGTIVYLFYRLLAGNWVRLSQDEINYLMRLSSLGLMHRNLEKTLFSIKSAQSYKGLGMQNIMRGPNETGIRYTGD